MSLSDPFLSVIVPTLNEADNLSVLAQRLQAVLGGGSAAWEVLVVDDASTDGTADRAEEALKFRGLPGRVIRRTGERGLARSVVEGIGSARGSILVVMDADLSHPPEGIPRLVEAVRGGADLAVASRYVAGGGVAGWPAWRRFSSRVACLLARPVVSVKDATSGFFGFRREVLEGVALDPEGWKIGLEIMVRGRCRRIVEVPYLFVERERGKSKFGLRQVVQYLGHLVSLYFSEGSKA
jgi:dolichol-phosphate mannosyltransferase